MCRHHSQNVYTLLAVHTVHTHVCTCTQYSTVEHSYNKPEIPGQTVWYKQEFVISEQFPMRYCSTWLRPLLCYVKKFVIEEFVIRVLHCIYIHCTQYICTLHALHTVHMYTYVHYTVHMYSHTVCTYVRMYMPTIYSDCSDPLYCNDHFSLNSLPPTHTSPSPPPQLCTTVCAMVVHKKCHGLILTRCPQVPTEWTEPEVSLLQCIVTVSQQGIRVKHV